VAGALLFDFFARALDSAELNESLTARFDGREASGKFGGYGLLDVELKFVVHFAAALA
jgi:hypothetical protein